MKKLMGAVDLVFNVYMKVHAHCEKSVLDILFDLSGYWCKNINERFTGNKLALPKFIWADLFNKYIPYLKPLKVRLIFS